MAKSFEDLGVATNMSALAQRFSVHDWWGQFRGLEALKGEALSVRLIEGQLEIDGDLRMGVDPWAIVVAS